MFSKILLLFISLSFDVVLGSLADSRMTGRVKGNPDGFDSDTTLAFLMLGRYKKGYGPMILKYLNVSGNGTWIEYPPREIYPAEFENNNRGFSVKLSRPDVEMSLQFAYATESNSHVVQYDILATYNTEYNDLAWNRRVSTSGTVNRTGCDEPPIHMVSAIGKQTIFATTFGKQSCDEDPHCDDD